MDPINHLNDLTEFLLIPHTDGSILYPVCEAMQNSEALTMYSPSSCKPKNPVWIEPWREHAMQCQFAHTAQRQVSQHKY
jgi:hypothetical protein